MECICHEKAREEEAQRRHLARMPHPPPGRIKYGIGGVTETPEGNVYILNQTIPIEPCECSKVYEKFQQEHAVCMELYEGYMNQMKEEIAEFVSEMGPTEEHTDENLEQVTEFPQEEDKTEIKLEKSSEKQEDEVCTCVEPQPKVVDVPVCKSLPLCCCYCGRVKSNGNECTCGMEVATPCIDCTCAPEEEVEEEQEEEEEIVEEEVEEEEETHLKRFFIYKKFLCSAKWQMDVLTKALESMADDGYPLAKLPNCHKLPHFKLWMQMRCGKYWTQEDKYASVLVSKYLWRHCDSCTVRKVLLPKLPITKRESHLVDWSRASYCRKMVGDALNNFYRTVRKNTVNFGREFFPSTFSYQFPVRTFRDCCFAYTPSKEEDVLAKFVWQKFENNNMADAKHCIC